MPHTYEYPHPAVTTDAVIFTVRGGRLEVLLIRRGHPPYEGRWAFPGGFLDYDEGLAACAARELKEETGISGVRLEQFHAAGTPGRDPRERNISILHLGLVADGQVEPQAGDDAAAVGWFDARRPPPLAFDHSELLALAREHLAIRIRTTNAALDLLPRCFTRADLAAVLAAVNAAQSPPGRMLRIWMATGLVKPVAERVGGRRLYRKAGQRTVRKSRARRRP
jgi:8-oxo-dGTP diphosphatase